MSEAILLESGNYTFHAALEDSKLDTIEQNHNSWQPIRRAALVVLCRDYEALAGPLVRNDEDKAETLIYLIEQLDEFLEWRKNEQELLEAAHARLMSVLSQEAERFTAGEATGRIDPGLITDWHRAREAHDRAMAEWPFEKGEPPITGHALDRASDAILQAMGEATAYAVWHDVEGDTLDIVDLCNGILLASITPDGRVHREERPL